MQPTAAARATTAIPPRFASQRIRVLRILARWERATLGAARPARGGSTVSPAVGAGVR
jgi:hypothetical protein